jgi:hypothetical protein
MNNLSTKEKLTILRDYLSHRIDDEEFDISTWHSDNEGGKRFANDDGSYSCGTVACAVGHAGSIPEFNALGFSLTDYGMPTYFTNSIGYSLYSWGAVSRFFGLHHNECIYLFDSPSYPNKNHTTKNEVVERLTQFINQIPND